MALAHVGQLQLLQVLFGRILIPPAVAAELKKPAWQPTAADALGAAFVEIRAPADLSRVEDLRRTLDIGESEALALAVEVGADALLIDERAGREAAKQLSLPVVGTLGILMRAKDRGLIPAVRPLMDRLQTEIGFRISVELRAEVLTATGER